jgi:transposase InsO family protein
LSGRIRYEAWREVAELLGFKTQERLRVEWMVFYYTVGKENATLTAQHFAISRKTFHKWLKRFEDSKYNVKSLADQSRTPRRKRIWEVTLTQEERIRRLRKRYPHYGKKKLKVLYEKEYCDDISTWKIERVIRRYKLYPDQKKQEKTARKRARARQQPKKRITQLVKEGRPYFLFHVDTVVIYWGNVKRYILTAVDHVTKLGYARMYKNKSSRCAADFLYRLHYLVNQPIENLQTDNGSEFAWEFERASAALGIERYFSRIKTPKDNPEIERFNQTLEYEWLYNFNLSLDPEELNPRLTEWLIEYNFNRPHQSLAYLSPIEYIEKELAKIHSPVLPMWSATTIY